MSFRIDHVVIWVGDARRSIEFFQSVVGLEGVRVEEFHAGKVPFPSMRLSEDTLLDLVPDSTAAALNAMGAKLSPTVATSAGHRIHHVCLAMSPAEYDALRGRIEAQGGRTVSMREQFGARGYAPEAFYFHDPDGNVFEARHYGSK
jgi:catechol 2,3-dioxygenase-like lactoylglutathione lyase family enzyme